MSNIARICFDADVTAPSVPVIASVVALSTTSLRSTWNTSTDSGTGIGGYSLYRSTSLAGPYVLIQTFSAASLTWDDTGLSPGTQYFYKVAAFDRATPVNVSAQSSAVSGTTNVASSGFDFYISPTGSDSNPGTLGSPWAITALNTKSATYAGKRVGLLDGTYNTSALPASAGGFTPALTVAAGDSTHQTVIAAVNPRMAILDDTGNSVIRPIIGAQNSVLSYITLRDLKIRGGNQNSVTFEMGSGRGVGIRIENCEVYNQSYSVVDITPAIFLTALDDAVVTNCYVHDITNTSQASSAVGVQMYGCKRTIIEKSTFDSTVYVAVHDKYASGSPRTDQQETVVRYNYFNANPIACWGFDNKDQTATPPSFPPYGPYKIHHNVFENCGDTLTNPGAFSAASPMEFYNNTLIANGANSNGPNLHTLAVGDEPSYYNNIWYLSGASLGGWRALVVSINGAGSAYTNAIDYNCYGPGSISWVTQTGLGYPFLGGGTHYIEQTTSSAWKSATGKDAHSLFSTNADFTGTGSGPDRFKLNGTSPCLNAGRVGGVSSGAAVHAGAWDGTVTQIGKNW